MDNYTNPRYWREKRIAQNIASTLTKKASDNGLYTKYAPPAKRIRPITNEQPVAWRGKFWEVA